MTVRRYVLQSRGWEDAQGHRADTLVLAAPQETPMSSPSVMVTPLSITWLQGDQPLPASITWCRSHTILLLLAVPRGGLQLGQGLL